MLMDFGMTCCMNQRVSKLKLLLNLQVKKQRPPIRSDYFEHLYLINLLKKIPYNLHLEYDEMWNEIPWWTLIGSATRGLVSTEDNEVCPLR